MYPCTQGGFAEREGWVSNSELRILVALVLCGEAEPQRALRCCSCLVSSPRCASRHPTCKFRFQVCPQNKIELIFYGNLMRDFAQKATNSLLNPQKDGDIILYWNNTSYRINEFEICCYFVRINLDRWTCDLAQHFLSLVIKIILFNTRKLFVILKVSKYSESCPEQELTKHHPTWVLM